MLKLLPVLVYIICKINPSEGYNFTTFNEPTGVFLIKTFETYISYSSWKLYYYYDMSEFFENVELYKECLQRMERICVNLAEKEQCETLIIKHRRLFANINLDIEYIQSTQQKKHKKRRDAFLGFAGSYLAKPIFGLMDEEDAQVINHKINELIKTHNTHTVALQNGLSIIKQTMKITNNTLTLFNENINQFNTYIQNITQIMAEVEKETKQHIDFNYISDLAGLINMEHMDTTDKIKSALKNTLHGEFTSLITYKQLLHDLTDISDQLDETSYMIVKDFKELQRIINIRGTITQKRLLIELTIPILERNVYQMNGIVTVPVNFQNDTILIKTGNTNYLVNNHTKIYIPIKKEELNSCKQLPDKKLICFPQTEAYFENKEECVSNILFEKHIQKQLKQCEYDRVNNVNVVKSLGENTYYIYAKEPILMRENCLKQTSNLFNISQTGMLTIDFGCEIIFNHMRIATKNAHIREKVVDIQMPQTFQKISISNLKPLNTRIQNIKKLETKFLSYSDNFDNLVNDTDVEITKLKSLNIEETIETDMLKKNVIILAVFIIIIIIIKAIIKKLC